MNKFDVTSYWNNRYAKGGNSGAGSYNKEAEIKSIYVNDVINKYRIKTISDIGCGDGNNLQYFNIPLSYVGYDVSSTAIGLCNSKYTDEKYSFTNDKKFINYNADLCLCLDVLFHQVEEELYQQTLDLLFRNNYTYVLIYSYDYVDNNPDLAPHMKIRKVSTDIENNKYNYKLIDNTIGYDLKKNFLLYEKE